MKREAELKAKFGAELRRRFPQAVTLLFSTAGAPDRCILLNGYTTMWEFKHGTPEFRSPGLQELMCMRLAEQSHCRYVLWLEDRHGDTPHTRIVHPRHVHDRSLTPDIAWNGYNIPMLVATIASFHHM